MKLSKMKKLRRYLFCFLSILLLSVTLLPANAFAATSLRGESIYQIMVDRFYDGDSGNNAAGEAFRYTENSQDDFRYMHGGDWQVYYRQNPLHKRHGLHCYLDLSRFGSTAMGSTGCFRQTVAYRLSRLQCI